MSTSDIVYLSVCAVFLVPPAIGFIWRWLVMCWEVFRG